MMFTVLQSGRGAHERPVHAPPPDGRGAQAQDLDLPGALHHEADAPHEGPPPRPDTHVLRLCHMQGWLWI